VNILFYNSSVSAGVWKPRTLSALFGLFRGKYRAFPVAHSDVPSQHNFYSYNIKARVVSTVFRHKNLKFCSEKVIGPMTTGNSWIQEDLRQLMLGNILSPFMPYWMEWKISALYTKSFKLNLQAVTISNHAWDYWNLYWIRCILQQIKAFPKPLVS